MIFVDMFDGTKPKRGDIVQTNVGDRRERTWLILRVRRSRTEPKGVPRFHLWIARWWELEADMRLRLYRSAERNGGQSVCHFRRYPAKKRSRLNAIRMMIKSSNGSENKRALAVAVPGFCF